MKLTSNLLSVMTMVWRDTKVNTLVMQTMIPTVTSDAASISCGLIAVQVDSLAHQGWFTCHSEPE
ncbi:hypothetical protein BG55_21545 [Erwinia mallotivora]|uniref:Uncharacterized protein n=1 Tax=Erwinia mallotivora TaxID=69222 RepID=A0A014M6U6_9GAMM|nr:hypothetical protein BG55_21545 [Erwinia mallotivora]